MEDEVLIVAIVFGSIVAIAWMIVSAILRTREKAQADAAEGAVGMRELEQYIREAVESGTEPLRLQIAQLEETIRANSRSLPEAEREGRLLQSHEPE